MRYPPKIFGEIYGFNVTVIQTFYYIHVISGALQNGRTVNKVYENIALSLAANATLSLEGGNPVCPERSSKVM